MNTRYRLLLSRRHFFCIIGLLFALGLCDLSIVSAYQQIRTPTGAGVKWMSMPVTWYYNHRGFTQFTEHQMIAIMQRAFQRWEAPACTSLRTSYLGTTTLLWSQTDGRNVLLWNASIPDPNYPTALALTIPAYDNNTGAYIDADIIFNGSGAYSWSENPSNQQYDIEGTATHEIGHMLGLDHTHVQDAVMYPTATTGVCPCRTLKQDDINGICSIYPSGSSGGNRKLGESCEPKNLCAQGLTCVIYQDGATSGFCHQTCPNGQCPNGEKCYQLNNGESACVCQNDSECSTGAKCVQYRCDGGGSNPNFNRKLGESCEPQNLCVQGLTCVIYQEGATSGFCHQTCPNGQCPNGEKCYSLSNGETACVCQNDSECSTGGKCVQYRCSGGGSPGQAGKEGQPCDPNGRCEAGLDCLKDPSGGQSICVRYCRADTDCTSGNQCDPQYQVCVPSAGKKQRGESCDNQNRCAENLICAVVQEGSTTGICLPSCPPNGSCPDGERCHQAQTGQWLCICIQDQHCTGENKTCQNYRCVTSSNPGGCRSDQDCPAGQICQQGQCHTKPGGCNSDRDCPYGQSCIQQVCVNNTPEPTIPDAGSSGCYPPCASGYICRNNTCIYSNTCNVDSDCHNSEICREGICQKAPIPDRTNPPNNTQGCGCDISSAFSFTSIWWLLLLIPLFKRRRS